MSEEIKTYTDTNWEDLLEYNGMTWINIDRFKSLQQKVEQLEERCEYLERSNNRREDEIIELRNENVDLVSKNNQLENIRKEAIEYCNTHYLNPSEPDLLNILNKGSDKE